VPHSSSLPAAAPNTCLASADEHAAHGGGSSTVRCSAYLSPDGKNAATTQSARSQADRPLDSSLGISPDLLTRSAFGLNLESSRGAAATVRPCASSLPSATTASLKKPRTDGCRQWSHLAPAGDWRRWAGYWPRTRSMQSWPGRQSPPVTARYARSGVIVVIGLSACRYQALASRNCT
jgi:hypothetical protein